MKRSDVEPWLQANMAALVVAGSVALDLGQGTLFKSLITGACAAAALLLTDWLGIFRLHRALANVAAIVALAYGLWEFWEQYSQGLDPVRQLLSIANLLIYLQIILLFQKKDVRKYWLLAVLSLLEIVVASALNLGVEFGILLVVYLILSASGMALFYVYRESLRLAADGRGLDDEAPPAKNPGDATMLVRRETASDVAGRLMSVRLWRTVVAMGGTSLAIGVIVFLTLPRMVGQPWAGRQTGPGASIGFTNQITLDEISPLLHSDEKVMRVAYSDARTGEPYQAIGSPYLRGAVLTQYLYTRDGKPAWLPPGSMVSRPGEKLPKAPPDVPLVRQVIQLEPTDSRILFSVYEPFRLDETTDETRVLHDVGVLVRGSSDLDEPAAYRYVVGVSGFQRGLQDPVSYIHPDVDWSSRFTPSQIFFMERRGLLSPFEADENGHSRFPYLVEAAREALKEAGAEDAVPEDKARALTLHFLQRGGYSYSTDFSKLQRDPTLDPLEDFVRNHRTGHCEYFAGALCLMLRSQGIPARIVVGYRSDEYNPLGGYYQVRQRDAHAWVEILLWPHEMSSEIEAPDRMIASYVRLDPTPLAATDELAATQSWLDKSLQAFDYAQLLWSDYVISMNSETQRKTVFDPLSDNTSEAVDRYGLSARWKSLTAMASRLGGYLLPAVAAVLAVVGAGLYLWRRGGPRTRKRLRKPLGLTDVDAATRARPIGRFFSSLADLLETVADERRPGETVGEWVARAIAVWRASADAPPEPAFAESLALYHEHRFGSRRVDEALASELRQRLTDSRESWLRRVVPKG